jgi:hypothetical protein
MGLSQKDSFIHYWFAIPRIRRFYGDIREGKSANTSFETDPSA